MGKINNDIPLEAVLKYIKEERDKYRTRLSEIVPYTKDLEQKYNKLSDQYDDLLQRFADNEVKMAGMKSQVGDVKRLQNENEFMIGELKALRTDYKQSAWFKQLKGNYAKLRERYNLLRGAYNKLLIGRGLTNLVVKDYTEED